MKMSLNSCKADWQCHSSGLVQKDAVKTRFLRQLRRRCPPPLMVLVCDDSGEAESPSQAL